MMGSFYLFFIFPPLIIPSLPPPKMLFCASHRHHVEIQEHYKLTIGIMEKRVRKLAKRHFLLVVLLWTPLVLLSYRKFLSFKHIKICMIDESEYPLCFQSFM